MASKITQISSFEYGSTSVSGILSVSYDDGIDNVIENKADDNLYATGGKATSASCSGTINGVDSSVFSALGRGGSETMVFKGMRVSDNVETTFTISNVMLEKVSPNLEHDGDGGVGLTFRAYSPDGETSPVAITTA